MNDDLYLIYVVLFVAMTIISFFLVKRYAFPIVFSSLFLGAIPLFQASDWSNAGLLIIFVPLVVMAYAFPFLLIELGIAIAIQKNLRIAGIVTSAAGILIAVTTFNSLDTKDKSIKDKRVFWNTVIASDLSIFDTEIYRQFLPEPNDGVNALSTSACDEKIGYDLKIILYDVGVLKSWKQCSDLPPKVVESMVSKGEIIERVKTQDYFAMDDRQRWSLLNRISNQIFESNKRLDVLIDKEIIDYETKKLMQDFNPNAVARLGREIINLLLMKTTDGEFIRFIYDNRKLINDQNVYFWQELIARNPNSPAEIFSNIFQGFEKEYREHLEIKADKKPIELLSDYLSYNINVNKVFLNKFTDSVFSHKENYLLERYKYQNNRVLLISALKNINITRVELEDIFINYYSLKNNLSMTDDRYYDYMNYLKIMNYYIITSSSLSLISSGNFDFEMAEFVRNYYNDEVISKSDQTWHRELEIPRDLAKKIYLLTGDFNYLRKFLFSKPSESDLDRHANTMEARKSFLLSIKPEDKLKILDYIERYYTDNSRYPTIHPYVHTLSKDKDKTVSQRAAKLFEKEITKNELIRSLMASGKVNPQEEIVQ